MIYTRRLIVISIACWLLGCQPSTTPHQEQASAASPTDTADSQPTASEAHAFVAEAEASLSELAETASRAAWVQSNFITQDTQIIAAKANEEATAIGVKLASAAARFNPLTLNYDHRRKLDIIKSGLTLPAPQDPASNATLARIASGLEAAYGAGQYCRDDGQCFSLNDLTLMLAQERDPALLQEIWTGWRRIAPAMKADYVRMVEIANQGAVELGYADVGVLWRSKYDMPADDFAVEMDRLWTQVRPLYNALHCHVRAQLGAHYGEELVPQDGPIPAHLLGNMWAQQWANVYDLVAPQDADIGYDLTERIAATGRSEIDMVRIAENFFMSLGFDALPDSFWQRSLFTKPADRDVVCHPSAWDIDNVNDLRIKMCIQKTADDFSVVHHELGHNFYQRAYNRQPFLYKNSANDGFHEAIGDTIALSVTPKYLRELGLIETIPDASRDIGLLLKMALDKVAFLPFGLLIDKWRWQVFAGEVSPERYNDAWWALRTQYQGIQPPSARSEDDFDPGAKYHIPANVPYSRYFLAHILQFQFHRALCEIAGNDGPLHRCSIYGSKAAGARLNQMLEMGASRPWPEALAVVTGSEAMDASAIIEYFAPLQTWLDQQNAGRQCGW